jgi:hypothetical protein
VADPPVQPPLSGAPAGRLDVLVAALAVLVAMLLADHSRMVDPDLFMNLFSARDILAVGGLPGVDSHSFAREALEWTDYEWLARVIQYGVYLGGGGDGLVVMRFGQALIAAGAVLLAARRAGVCAPAAAVALMVAWPAVAHFLLLRARAFSFVMLALLLLVVVEHRRGSRFAAWAIPPLMLVWANMHGAWLLGVGLVVMALIDASTPWTACRGSKARLAVALGLGAALTFVHPAGGGLLEAVLRTVTGTASATITEWQPIWQHSLRATITYAALLPVAAGVVLWRLVGRRDLLWSGLLLVMIWETIQHVRFGALLGLCLVVPLALLLDPICRRQPLAWRAATLVLLVALAVALPIRHGHRNLHIRMDPWWTPVAAVSFMQDNRIAGDVLAEFDWGAYLIWQHPEARVFIDGRWDTVYPPEVNDEWTTFALFREGWQGVLEGSGATAVLLRAPRAAEAPLSTVTGWYPVYSDEVSELFLRDCELNRPFLLRLSRGEIVPPRPVTERDLVLR